MSKPDFSTIYYDPHHICWGRGNNAVSLSLLARFKIGEPTPEMDAAQKADYEKAKAMYDEFVNKGVRFAPSGKMANRDVVAAITFIHYPKQAISWKQDNLTDEEKAKGYKPAAGKFTINSFISLIKGKEIEIIIKGETR